MPDLPEIAEEAYRQDPDPEMFLAIYELLKQTFAEIRDESGRGYNASRAYQSLYRNGARESVRRAILNPNADGFGRVGDAGRLDLSYEWFALNPRWAFAETIRERAWSKLNPELRSL